MMIKPKRKAKYRIVVPLSVVRYRYGRLSQTELSNRTGIHQGTLSRLETGKAGGIDFSTLALLCEAMECKPGDLLELEEIPEDQAEQLQPEAPAAGPQPKAAATAPAKKVSGRAGK